jgi:hypothetical protein
MKSKIPRKPILYLAILIFVCSCAKQPKCNDEQTISLLRQNIYNQLNLPKNKLLIWFLWGPFALELGDIKPV